MSHTTKTIAKRMGVKSVLSYGDKGNLAITSFGKGNSAEIAVKTDKSGSNLALPFRTKQNFTVKNIQKKIDLERGALTAQVSNPAENVPEDYLQLKGTLEKKFFGQEYPNDNVRIQIIYNILDIQKILGLYVNDILYCINNLQDEDNKKEETAEEETAEEETADEETAEEEDGVLQDVLGQSLNDKDKIANILRSMEPYLGFFGDAFKTDKDMDSYNATVLRAISAIRHETAHSGKFFLFSTELKSALEKASIDWNVIHDCYKARIDKINQDFMTHSKMNLHILFDMFQMKSEEQKREIAEEYYRFSILKEGKNLGVNMRKVREYVIDQYCAQVKDKEYDSFRSKLYTILDFVIFRIMSKSPVLKITIDKLRSAVDDTEKEKVYRSFSQQVWNNVKRFIDPFFRKYSRGFIVYTSEEDISESLIQKVKLNPDEGIPLVELLSFLCNFWEGKEINEILSAYIHKFESIQSFLDTLEELGEKVEFKTCPIFNLPNISLRISSDLRILASIGKMKPDLTAAKRPLYKAAIQLLGCKDDSQYLTNEWIAAHLLADKTAISKEKRKQINPMRNFIANNVIESRRFTYIVRYTKPRAARALMQNSQIVRYVLTRLPDKQIDSYFKNISGDETVPLDKKIEKLSERILNLSFDSFEKNRSNIVKNSTLSPSMKNVEVERLKALVGLYLTVAYVAIKNLVKANARYYIAFGIYDRDYEFLGKKNKSLSDFVIRYTLEDKKRSNKYHALTEYFLDREDKQDYHPEPGQPFDKEACRKHLDSIRRHFSRKWRDIFRLNIDEAKQINETGFLSAFVRNEAAHLNVLMLALPKYVQKFRSGKPGMTSYFELYHFLLQKRMLEEEGLNIPEAYKTEYLDKGVPCSDLIKIAYVSLGYCLPRYKNLTIEPLFDQDSVTGKEMAERMKK